MEARALRGLRGLLAFVQSRWGQAGLAVALHAVRCERRADAGGRSLRRSSARRRSGPGVIPVISESGLVRIARKGGSGCSAPMPAKRAELWLSGTEEPWKWETLRVIGCRVCGAPAIAEERADGHFWIAPHPRCERHLDRNPCAIEGCKRSRATPADGMRSDDNAICGTHWRAYVPPGSRVRRAYNAHWRRAKRLGWTLERIDSFHRLWDTIIRMARRRAGEGFVNEAEINRIMGWD